MAAITDLLNTNWGPYSHTEVEEAIKEKFREIDRALESASTEGGIGYADLSKAVQDILDLASTALQPSSIANWAKQPNKPGYTVGEIIYDGLTTLSQKLAAMDAAIQQAAASGAVEPDSAMSDSSENAVQNKIVKAYIDAVSLRLDTLIGSNNAQGVIDTFNEVKAFLNGINTSDPTLYNTLQGLQTSINGKLGKSDVSVSVPSSPGGIFVIHVGETDYTINLNHTHENMAKLVVCEESDLPSTLDNSTIYAITDSGETEIEKLIIRGLEFAGGGVPDTGEPMISSPSNGTTINLGENSGSGVSKTITIKGKNLTGDLTVAVGTGLTISYGQLTGQSSVTIPMAQALLGAQVTIAYSGSGALDDGSLVISHGGSALSSVVVIVVFSASVPLAAIRLTGTQWLKTDYKPNPNTEFELECKFTAHSNSPTGVISTKYFMTCQHESDNRFNFGIGGSGFTDPYYVIFTNNTKDDLSDAHVGSTKFFLDHSILKYEKNSTRMRGMFRDVTTSNALSLKSATMQSDWAIGYAYYNNTIFSDFYLTIYGLKITENGSVVRNYKPYMVDGVPGLYCDVTDTFISSETAADVEYDEVE